MKEAHKRNRNPKYKKQTHQSRDWSKYDQSLRNRGDITLWFSKEAIKAWTPKPTGKRGSQRKYSDIAIETALSLRLLFHLPLRQTEGFVASILSMMKLKLPTPDHTTLSRRAMTLKPILNCGVDFGKPLHIIVDSTGLSIHGEGPWSRHKHGKKRRRGWRKLHIIIDSQGIIHTAIISTGHTRDASRVPPLLKDIKAPISSFIGDKGYDQGSVYRAVLKNNKDANIVIHPRMNAVLSSNAE